MQNIKENIKNLEGWFDRINKKFYDGELKRPVITIAPDNKRKAYGWFTTWKAWKETGTEEATYEINISANYNDRPQKEIITTLMHEMVHLYCHENNIQDTSRGGTYHNKKYKEEAERHGLSISKDEKYGWTITELNEESTRWIETFKETAWLYRPDGESKKGKGDDDGTTRKSSYKHVCPNCGNIARTTKRFTLLCGECLKEASTAEDIKKCIMKIEN